VVAAFARLKIQKRAAPDRTKIRHVSGKIEIVGKEALRNIYSPSHQIDVKRKGENGASVSFETNGNDNDFQLFYGLSNNDFGMSLLTYREPGKTVIFCSCFRRKIIRKRELVNKDIVFVLDTSGSMAEEGKMEKARAALCCSAFANLRDGDRFNVINFAGEEHLMESRLISADADGKTRGEEFVKKLQPTGGTNINDALRAALKQFDSSTTENARFYDRRFADGRRIERRTNHRQFA
jgi:Mg-chelatase subunit ChlD